MNPVDGNEFPARELIQSWLPHGLQLGDPLRDGDPVGRSYHALDHRGSQHRPLPRVVRWLALTADDREEWLPELERRAQVLARQHDPGLVVAPLEIGEGTGRTGIFIVQHTHQSTLAAHIEQAGLNASIAGSLLEQLADQLAALHDMGIEHGEICPQNVLLSDGQLGNRTRCWLGAVLTGHVRTATANRIVRDQLDLYLPAPSLGIPEMSKAADVHSFAMLSAAAHLGCRNLTRDAHKLIERLKTHHTCPTWLERILTGTSPKRCRDGLQLASFIRANRRTWNSWHWSVLAAVLVAAVAFGLGNHHSSHSIATLKRQVVDLELELEKRDEEIARLTPKMPSPPPPFPPPPSPPSAQAFWKEHAEAARGPLDMMPTFNRLTAEEKLIVLKWKAQLVQVDEARTKIAKNQLAKSPMVEHAVDAFAREPWAPNALENVSRVMWRLVVQNAAFDEIHAVAANALLDLPLENTVRATMSGFATKWRDLRTQPAFKRWGHTRKILGDLETLKLNPWDRSSYDAHATDLEAAFKIWEEQLTNVTGSRLSGVDGWKEFKNRIGDRAKSDGVQKLLKEWVQFFEDQKSWTLTITGGTSDSGYGKYRRLIATVEGKTFQMSEAWEKDNNRGSVKNSELKLLWTPGQSLSFDLYTDRSYWRLGLRPCLIDKTYDGPLALWTLLCTGTIQDSGANKLLFVCPEFADFPRPR